MTPRQAKRLHYLSVKFTRWIRTNLHASFRLSIEELKEVVFLLTLLLKKSDSGSSLEKDIFRYIQLSNNTIATLSDDSPKKTLHCEVEDLSSMENIIQALSIEGPPPPAKELVKDTEIERD